MDITKPQISAVELHAIVAELQAMNDSKIVQFYQSEESEFFIELYNRHSGKKMLRIIPGKYMYITNQKPKMESPSGFCMFLRKYFINAVIESIEQIEAQRIVKLTIRSKERVYNVYLEFFAKGNIIVCEKDIILLPLTHQELKARSIKAGETYTIPPLELNIFTAKKKELDQRLKKIKEAELVKTLATSLGLGGMIAEEVCMRTGIPKNATELSPSESEQIVVTIQSLLKEQPKGHIYEKSIAPIALKSQTLIKTVETFNEALDQMLSTSSAQREKLKKEAQYQEKIKSVQHILSQQEEKLKDLEIKVEDYKKKGDWFYENYKDVKTLLDRVQQERAEHGWQGAQKFLSSLKKIKKIDLKEKRITLETK